MKRYPNRYVLFQLFRINRIDGVIRCDPAYTQSRSVAAVLHKGRRPTSFKNVNYLCNRLSPNVLGFLHYKFLTLEKKKLKKKLCNRQPSRAKRDGRGEGVLHSSKTPREAYPLTAIVEIYESPAGSHKLHPKLHPYQHEVDRCARQLTHTALS